MASLSLGSPTKALSVSSESKPATTATLLGSSTLRLRRANLAPSRVRAEWLPRTERDHATSSPAPPATTGKTTSMSSRTTPWQSNPGRGEADGRERAAERGWDGVVFGAIGLHSAEQHAGCGPVFVTSPQG